MTSIFATAYFPPAIQYSKYLKSDKILIEGFEHFQKQSYRNRAYIMTASGVFKLTVPLKDRKNHQYTRDIKISYTEDWQKIHWRSIYYAYRNSPFFEYYEETIQSIFFTNRPKYLLDLNLNIDEHIHQLLNIDYHLECTKAYIETVGNIIDYRSTIHPKNKNFSEKISQSHYLQVYADRYPFEKNMSIIDVLFNLGPETYSNLLAMRTSEEV